MAECEGFAHSWIDYGEDVEVQKYSRPYAIDRGYGIEMVQFRARRKGRPTVYGYGMTDMETLEALEALREKD